MRIVLNSFYYMIDEDRYLSPGDEIEVPDPEGNALVSAGQAKVAEDAVPSAKRDRPSRRGKASDQLPFSAHDWDDDQG